MEIRTLIFLVITVITVSAWSIPFYPVPQGHRITRFAPPPPHRIPVRVISRPQEESWHRDKRNHHDDDDYSHDSSFGGPREDKGVTGPVHTFVKTDKNANYKWGVRHHVGNKYAS